MENLLAANHRGLRTLQAHARFSVAFLLLAISIQLLRPCNRCGGLFSSALIRGPSFWYERTGPRCATIVWKPQVATARMSSPRPPHHPLRATQEITQDKTTHIQDNAYTHTHSLSLSHTHTKYKAHPHDSTHARYSMPKTTDRERERERARMAHTQDNTQS